MTMMRLKSLVSPLLDVTACLELVVESVHMYKIQQPITYVWHTQILSVSYSYSGSTNQLLLLFSCTPPPLCPAEAFSDNISRSQALILSIPSPLPNVIIMLGDLNFPDINWTNPDMSCQYTISLISLSDSLFLNQQVLEPTRKSIILD